jgi:hypothetical protein
MTNWTDEQLERLVNIDNHKMVKDTAGETRWMHTLEEGVWDIHSIKVFEEEKLAYSWMYFWITKWDDELRLRKSTRAIKVRKRLKRIKRSVRMLLSDKIIEMSELLPSYTHLDIANELGVSTKTVQRAIKQMSS